ncbi:germ cell nuclear acidic protein-like [Engystomops pustulosus]|uniref:germ cell nuclear acidic protein-like n=1 Tax=Engystomops pustulosus TaxID=76066 RepID=UPI003AFAA214
MPKRCFTIESDTGNSDGKDQLLVNKKCRRISASDIEDSSSDETLHQFHPLPRSLRSLEDYDDGSGPHLLYIQTEPSSPRFSFVDIETASNRRSERPTNNDFLKNLSSPISKFVTNFRGNRQELTRRLYKFYNRTVFENQLPASMDISWNKRLRRTSGRTGYQLNNGEREAFIQLSDKVCDSAERLRDTLIHELCHAACWILDGEVEPGHGWLWESYCERVAQILHDLPPITAYHNYKIHYTVIYQCTACQASYGRWTASLDTEKYCCGYCKNRLVLINPT